MAWAPDYVTSDDLKGDLRITDNIDDVRVARAVTAASRAVDRATHRQFGKLDAPAPLVYTARATRAGWVIEIDDLTNSTGLTITNSDGATVATWKLQPANAVVKGKAWTQILVDPESANQPDSTVDGTTVTVDAWGWTDVPVTVQAATLLQANRFFKRPDAPFGVAGSPESGSELRLLSKVDPDVAVMLRDYVRDPVVFG